MAVGDPEFRVLSEQVVYKRYISVVDRRVAFPPDGREVAWDVATSRNFVTVLPFHSKDKTFTVIREYCQGPNKMCFAIAGGQFDPTKAKTRLECSQMELSEEARLHGGQWVSLLPDDHPGIPELKWVTNLFTPFLVIDPTPDPNPGPRDDEEIIEIHRLPVEDVRQLILKGEMMLPSAQTFWMACDWLQKNGHI